MYEVTFRIKPLEIVKFAYHVHDVDALTQDQVEKAIASNDSMVCWTVGGSVVIQTRNRATELRHEWLAGSRQFGWNFLAAFIGRAIRQHTPGTALTHLAEDVGAGVELGFYRLLNATGGFTLYNPDKMIDYHKTPQSARYAFTFWAFPRQDWVKNLKAYVEFAESHFTRHGFRCNMPLGSSPAVWRARWLPSGKLPLERAPARPQGPGRPAPARPPTRAPARRTDSPHTLRRPG